MTESEWQEGRELHPMLLFTAERLTGRKLRLYTVGCCRRHWELFNRDEAKRLVSDAEQLADGVGDEDAVRQLAQDALQTYLDLTIPWVQRTLTQAARECVTCSPPDYWGHTWQALHNLVDVVAFLRGGVREEAFREPERDAHRQLFRDVVGNPFRSVVLDPSWLTSTTLSLARQMYDSRDFSLMPILADALQDAGCEDAEILAHCRAPGEHVRGCWVVDLVLGKQ